ncbi:hypothetical protein ATE80_00230 [Streptomyces kanasensis]|uniref:Uncharacterized protein n=1 Tax=Streptomyces kanasensis TaxID=936756 RepID=A0A100YAG7_9ACTN|nr:hypothetical protein ATE80_00230 [Streptomyces kanasensis]
MLPFALPVAGFTGCTGPSGASACDGTAERAEQLRAEPVLDVFPRGAEPAGRDAGCTDDGGEASVYADRSYTFSGSRGEVYDFYRSAAAAKGWTPSEPPDSWGRLCFAREDQGDRVLLLVFATDRGPTSDYGIVASGPPDGADTRC